MNRRLKVVFTISVLLNMLLIGVLAGSCYKRMNGPGKFHERPPVMANSKLKQRMADARRDQEALHDQLKSEKRKLLDVLAAPNFNEEEFRQASERIDRAQEALFIARSETMLKMVKDMTTEERQDMARHMQFMADRRGKSEGIKGRKVKGKMHEPREEMQPAPEE